MLSNRQGLKVKEAKSLSDKIVGLLSAKKPYALLLQTRFGIHTFGMKFPIDVVVLNQKRRVVAIKQNLAPNRLYFWNPRYDTIIELPVGTIVQKKIQVGAIFKDRHALSGLAMTILVNKHPR